MAVTDQAIMSGLQLAMLEPDDLGVTWPSGMWTQAEVVTYLNDRQRCFLKEAGIVQTTATVNGMANKRRYDFPANTIDVRRIGWRNGPSGTEYVELVRTDPWELHHGVTNYTTSTAVSPETYHEDVPSQQFEVNPEPTDMGQMHLILTTLETDLDGAGTSISVPDDFAPYLGWGVKANMLFSEGEANDPVRAAYCEQRYQEGIELAKIMLGGPAAQP